MISGKRVCHLEGLAEEDYAHRIFVLLSLWDLPLTKLILRLIHAKSAPQSQSKAHLFFLPCDVIMKKKRIQIFQLSTNNYMPFFKLSLVLKKQVNCLCVGIPCVKKQIK